jgi:hypothetical protein
MDTTAELTSLLKGAQTQSAAPAAAPAAGQIDFSKLSNDIRRQVIAEVEYKQKVEKASQDYVSSVRQQVSARVEAALNKISSARAMAILDKVGQLNEAGRAKLSEYMEEADAAAEELTEGMIEGALAEGELEEMLIEAAAGDPDTAADLIAAETGQEVSPEEVDSAAEAIVSADASGDEEEFDKVSSALGGYGPRTQRVLVGRAMFLKASAANAAYLASLGATK